MGLFGRNKKEKEVTGDAIPKGVGRTLPRPTEDDIKKVSESVSKLKTGRPLMPKIDPMFLQDISDRLYGPDSEAYVEALRKLNSSFRPRVGKNCIDFYDPEIVMQTKEREKEINDHIKETE